MLNANAPYITKDSMQVTNPKATAAARAPFFKNDTFYNLYFPVGIYYAIANFALLFFKLPVAELAPADCFQLEPPSQPPIAIVTGSNTGIGYETASSLVERGYKVILACRDEKKGKKAAKDINSMIGNKKECGEAIFETTLDLSSLASVRLFSDYFSKKYNHLNVLVNNAGINSSGKSVDDLDLCFQTNFLGHFLLTNLLLTNLLNAKNKHI